MDTGKYITGNEYLDIRSNVVSELVQLLARDLQVEEDKASRLADCYAAYIMTAITSVVDVVHEETM